MARQHIYTVYRGGVPTPPIERTYRVVKMEADFEPVETYEVSQSGGYLHCTCYAGNKPTCRHRAMVELYEKNNLVDSRRAYQFDKQRWVDMPKGGEV